jgi:hypothetical protein
VFRWGMRRALRSAVGSASLEFQVSVGIWRNAVMDIARLREQFGKQGPSEFGLNEA